MELMLVIQLSPPQLSMVECIDLNEASFNDALSVASGPASRSVRQAQPQPAVMDSPGRELPYSVMAEEQSSVEIFEELAMPLFGRLYNFAHWLTQNRAEAEDLVQETYMKALKGFGSFRQGTNFRAWIYQILRNTFLTSRAGLRAGLTAPLDSEDDKATEPATNETPETVLLARADQEVIEKALEELPVKFREVILLCDSEEMSYQEIADTLVLPVGTVMSRLWRGRKALRELLAVRVRGISR
jgi:RNA polymerase sigma-70 factor, ECF subfamily